MKRLPRELFKLLPIAMGGVVLGHALVYRWLFVSPAHMHEGYSAQHNYLPVFVMVSGIVSAVSLGYYMMLGYRKEQHNKTDDTHSFWRLTLCLFVVQSALFIAMELLERSHGGFNDAMEFLNSSLVVYGVVFQFLTAALVALSVSTAKIVGQLIARIVSRSMASWCERFMRTVARPISEVFYEYNSRGPPKAAINTTNTIA